MLFAKYSIVRCPVCGQAGKNLKYVEKDENIGCRNCGAKTRAARSLTRRYASKTVGRGYQYEQGGTSQDDTGVREGVFRVGGENQYFHVNPVINDIGQIVDYRIEFKIGKFEPTSVTSNIKGEVIVMADDVGDAKQF